MKRYALTAITTIVMFIALGMSQSVYAEPGANRTPVSSEGTTVSFPPGVNVVGSVIRIKQGTNTFKGLSCVLFARNNADGGTVEGGAVIDPWEPEMAGKPNCFDVFVFESSDSTATSTPAPASSATPAPSVGPITEIGSGGYREFGPGAETRPSEGRTWTIQIDQGMVLLVGGYEVNGRDRGVYLALEGPQTVTVRVTDGFVQLVRADIARDEFCRRVNQARRNNWALTFVEPLAGWQTC